MSRARPEKNETKRSRPQGQSGTPADVSPTVGNRASIPVAETRYDPTHDEIAARAFRCWHERGCPDGSPEIDWSRAERELRSQRSKAAAAT